MRDPQGSTTPSGLKVKGLRDAKNRQACGGRMCAMFYPGDLQKRKKATQSGVAKARPKQKNAPAAIGSGWSASTNSN